MRITDFGPASGGSLPPGINTGDVLTWDGSAWLPESGIKDVWVSVQIPNNNNTWTNVNNTDYIFLGTNIPALQMVSANKSAMLSIAVPSNVKEIIDLRWEFVPQVLNHTGTLTYTLSQGLLLPSPSFIGVGGTLSQINPVYPYSQKIYTESILSLLPSLSNLGGATIGCKINSNSAGIKLFLLGLRLIYK